MNYIEEDCAFERWCENNHLPIQSQAIWKKLFKRFNRSGWSEWVTVTNRALMAEVQIQHEKTFILFRDKLKDAGLIGYMKGKKGSPGKYKLISFQKYTSNQKYTSINEVQTTAEQKYTSINEVQATAEREVYPTVQTAAETTDIIKQDENKQNNKNKNIKKEIDFFIAPTTEEVAEYCRERKNHIDAESFVSFYASKGWMVGRNKMKDWKSAVVTWEKNSFNNSNQAVNNDHGKQCSYDLNAFIETSMRRVHGSDYYDDDDSIK